MPLLLVTCAYKQSFFFFKNMEVIVLIPKGKNWPEMFENWTVKKKMVDYDTFYFWNVCVMNVLWLLISHFII